MKEELKKYLNSETELNKQSIHIRKIGLTICISLICVGIVMLIFAMIMLLNAI